MEHQAQVLLDVEDLPTTAVIETCPYLELKNSFGLIKFTSLLCRYAKLSYCFVIYLQYLHGTNNVTSLLIYY